MVSICSIKLICRAGITGDSMEKERRTPKKLTINIPEDYHRRIKILALERNMTLRKYVLQTLMARVLQEETMRE